ncbi:MAG: molybdopterin-dependent oxidoreductase [bacterium]|nr:molybdopterin-dependent oxidoreductase [bacterium]
MERESANTPDSTPASWRSRFDYALVGLIATGAALAASELVAGLFLSAPSLIRTIGQRVIDITPAPVEDWAISTFGTNDKLVLITGIVVVSLVIGALLGLLSRERPRVAAAGFVAFGVVGFVVGLTDPLSGALLTLVAAVVASGAGVGVLLGLSSLLDRAAAEVTDSGSPGPEAGSRRTFVTASTSAVVLAVGGVALGRFFARREESAVSGREQVTLPSASDPPPATTTTEAPATTSAAEVQVAASTPTSTSPATTEPAGEARVSGVPDPTPAQVASVDGVSELVTPNADFYRIDTALSVPRVDVDTWTLSFSGLVDNPFTATYDELLAMPLVERYVTLCCVSNSVGGGLVGNAKWLGVPLRDLVEQAGVRPEGTQLVGRSVDEFTVGFPTSAVFDGREALVAVGMNGEPLPLEHGFPARLVVSGLYGFVSATKWLSEIEFAGWDDFDAYWIPRGWAKEAPIKTQSRIDTPRAGSISGGPTVIAGVAWAQNRGIERVEVQVDEGPWMDANLPEELSIDSWRQWYLEHDLGSGVHVISVRATDATGETQTAEVQEARPDGATGYHMVRVTVG